MDNTQQAEAGLDKSLFKRNGFPPLGSLIPTSLQHVLASFAGVITPAMMIASTCGFTPEQETAIIQVALILSAIDTLLQQFPLFGRIGSGLPILTGASFAFLPALQAVGGEFGFSVILGAEMVGGIVAIVFSLFYDKIRWIFPPLVTGTVIFTIGVSLYPTAIKYIAGGVGTENFGSAMNWIVGLITFAVTFGLTNFTKGITKIGSIFFAIIIGCVVSIPFGMIDPSSIGEAAWFSLPKFMPFELKFDPAVCITIAIIYVMVNIQLIGDLSAATAGSMDRMPKGREVSGGIMAQGLVSILASLFGGVPTSAFGQNVGIIVSTKVINRWVFGGAAIVFMAAGLCPKLSALLLDDPAACHRRRHDQRVRHHYAQRYPNPREGRPHAAHVHHLWRVRRLWPGYRAGLRLAHGRRHAWLDQHDLWHVRHHALRHHGHRPEPAHASRARRGGEEASRLRQRRGGRGVAFADARSAGVLLPRAASSLCWRAVPCRGGPSFLRCGREWRCGQEGRARPGSAKKSLTLWGAARHA